MSFVKISLLPDYDSIFHAWLVLQMGSSHDPSNYFCAWNLLLEIDPKKNSIVKIWLFFNFSSSLTKKLENERDFLSTNW